VKSTLLLNCSNAAYLPAFEKGGQGGISKYRIGNCIAHYRREIQGQKTAVVSGHRNQTHLGSNPGSNI
jgi:hypothetical protein